MISDPQSWLGQALFNYLSTSVFYTNTSLSICSLAKTMYSFRIFGGLSGLIAILAISHLAVSAPIKPQDSDIHVNDPRVYITPPRAQTNEPRMYIPPSDDHINEPRMYIPPSDDHINDPRMYIPPSDDHLNEPRMHICTSNWYVSLLIHKRPY